MTNPTPPVSVLPNPEADRPTSRTMHVVLAESAIRDAMDRTKAALLAAPGSLVASLDGGHRIPTESLWCLLDVAQAWADHDCPSPVSPVAEDTGRLDEIISEYSHACPHCPADKPEWIVGEAEVREIVNRYHGEVVVRAANLRSERDALARDVERVGQTAADLLRAYEQKRDTAERLRSERDEARRQARMWQRRAEVSSRDAVGATAKAMAESGRQRARIRELESEVARSAPAIPQDAAEQIARALHAAAQLNGNEFDGPWEDRSQKVHLRYLTLAEDGALPLVRSWLSAPAADPTNVGASAGGSNETRDRVGTPAPAADPAPATCPECLCAGGIHKTWCKRDAAPARSCSCGSSCACCCVCDDEPAPATGDAPSPDWRAGWAAACRALDAFAAARMDAADDRDDKPVADAYGAVTVRAQHWMLNPERAGQAPAQPTATPATALYDRLIAGASVVNGVPQTPDDDYGDGLTAGFLRSTPHDCAGDPLCCGPSTEPPTGD